MVTSDYKRILKERKERIGECELCGSKRGLELHHCIPVVAGGEDTENNLILVCQSCHTKLTPRSELTKLGLRRKMCMGISCVQTLGFYERLNSLCENDERLDAQCVMDVFDELKQSFLVFPFEKEAIERYVEVNSAHMVLERNGFRVCIGKK